MKGCERIGVYEKWPKLKGVIERFNKYQAWVYEDEENIKYTEQSLKEIKLYIDRCNEDPHKIHVTQYDGIETLGGYKTEMYLIQALQGHEWLLKLAQWNIYYQVGLKQKFFWHHKFDSSPTRSRNLESYSVQYAANMMAITSLLGWKDAVIQQGCMTIAALNRGYQLVLEYQDEHRRAQAFMLRLFCDWVGDVSHQWPDYAYDEPIYEALLQSWRNPNPEDLVPCLLAACDRHTWQTGRESSKNFYDFSIPALIRVPIEILFLFRLREWEGLTNPTLDHPLMATPFDKLPETQPIPELDALMQGVLKRAREDWPNYDEVLSIENLKKII